MLRKEMERSCMLLYRDAVPSMSASQGTASAVRTMTRITFIVTHHCLYNVEIPKCGEE
jgi:ArsR family metal-binding transcriptional regulator